jgi:hypothetical protein
MTRARQAEAAVRSEAERKGVAAVLWQWPRSAILGGDVP